MSTTPPDPYDLQRFVDAQEGSYQQALAELRAGRKRTHWIWYVLPQIEGLGTSAMSRRYAIGSLAEARAYLEHPILGARLRECVAAVNGKGASSFIFALASRHGKINDDDPYSRLDTAHRLEARSSPLGRSRTCPTSSSHPVKGSAVEHVLTF